MTYKHKNDGCAGSDGLAIDFTRSLGHANVALRASHALSFSDIGVKCCFIALLRNGLDFGPNGLVLGTQEE